jgi:hypothetical protein
MALLEHRDVGDAMQLGKVVGCGKAMAATAYDHRVVGSLRPCVAPGRLPCLLSAERPREEAEDRIVHRLAGFRAGPIGGRDAMLPQADGRQVSKPRRVAAETRRHVTAAPLLRASDGVMP